MVFLIISHKKLQNSNQNNARNTGNLMKQEGPDSHQIIKLLGTST
jgi:hypothetical protein